MLEGAAGDASGVDEALRRVVRERRLADLATVVISPAAGSIRMGQKLLVDMSGDVFGTLGEAALDRAVVADSATILDSRKSQVIAYEADGGEVEIFHEILEPKPQLLIVGAGHIAVPLARLGHLMGFEVVVVDDREKFANAERFPDADEVIAADFGETLKGFPLTPSTFVVIITRAHTYDEESLRLILGRPSAYVGMIGSRRRVQTVLRVLAAEGHDEARLAAIHAPIGLDIGSETPEEIALSIISEVVAARRGGTGVPLSRQMRPIAL